MSLRCAVARPVGSPELGAEVARYERSRLAEREKTALRLADGFLADPGGFGVRRRRETLAYFEPVQVLELVLKLVQFSSDKTAVALGLDGPAVIGRLSDVRYEDGVAIVTPGVPGEVDAALD